MKVELVAYTRPEKGDCADIVERAAAVCYDSLPDGQHRIAKACARSGHMSVWEHINFTFHVKGVSRALLAQLSRHRHISLSVRSQRYCSEDGFDYVTPDSIRADPDARGIFDAFMQDIDAAYRDLQGAGIPNEDARALLPNGCVTELYMTANARALVEMARLRLCMRAQAEIRELFQELREAVRPACPLLAQMMVPKCEKYPSTPFCDEQKGCGRHPKLSVIYKRG